jgi:threonine/homoserine/homoserine lactone efflux protein
MISLEFLLTALVVVVIPGTGTIYTVSTGLFQGWRASIAAAIGCTLGIVPHMAVGILGISAIIGGNSLVFQGLTVAGALYLMYLAWGIWHDQGSLRFEANGAQTRTAKIMARAIVLNLLNPKLTLFFLAFMPLFIAPEAPTPTIDLFVLSGVFMAMTLVVFVGYGILASGVRTSVEHSPQAVIWLRRGCAVVLAVLAVQLLF